MVTKKKQGREAKAIWLGRHSVKSAHRATEEGLFLFNTHLSERERHRPNLSVGAAGTAAAACCGQHTSPYLDVLLPHQAPLHSLESTPETINICC